MTAWKYSRVMPLDTESESLASTIWELIMQWDLLLEDEEEYLEDELSTKVLIVEI